MKKNIPYIALCIQAIACICLAIMPTLAIGSFTSIMAFPFEQIGKMLRALSLASAGGNIVAMALYIIICLAPCLALLPIRDRKYYPEDGLIILLCAVLFFVIYKMVNPFDIGMIGGVAQGIPVAKAVLSGVFYSIVIGYLILRFLRLFSKSNNAYRYLKGLLYALNMLFIAIIFLGGVSNAASAIVAMNESNSANKHLFGVNIAFIILSFIVTNIPYALNIFIVFVAIRLINNMNVSNAKLLAKACYASLVTVTISNIGFNFLQILFAKSLFNVSASIQIPLFSIIFVLGCLLFTKLMQENDALKAENDGFI